MICRSRGGGWLAGAAALGAREPRSEVAETWLRLLSPLSSRIGEAAGAGGRGSAGEEPGARLPLLPLSAPSLPRLPHLPQWSPHRPDRDHAPPSFRFPFDSRARSESRKSLSLRLLFMRAFSSVLCAEVLLFPRHQPLCIHRLRVLCRCS